MEKIWLKHYPAGVPAEIDPDKYQSIRDLFDECVASFADRPAYHCMGAEITFGELESPVAGDSAPGCRRRGCKRATASR